MSLAGAVQPGHVLKEMLYLAPNTVDFCAMELQSLLHSLLQVPQAAKSPESDSDGVVGRWVPTFYTITQLAVLTIRAASVCRPRRYVAELCQSVVKHLLPAQASAAAFLTKDVLAGLPSAAACCTVLRVAAIATIIRECARPGMAGEAVKWMTESLPEDFPAAVYAFFDGPFLAEYERISRQPASANTTIIGKRSTKCLPASLFRESSGRQQQGGEEGNGGNGSTKSWQPLLADIFTSEEVVGVPAAVSFLYAKRLCNAVLYLVRKAVAVFPQASFEEERWADLIGRCMAQSKLAFAHPQMLRLARSILSTDTELFRRIDSVGQARLATFLEVLSAKTDRFARPPSVEDQARLLELLYAQFSVLLLRPWSWRAHGLTHPKTVPLIYKLALAYVYSRKVRRDIVNLAIILLGSLFDCNDDDDNDGGDNSNKVLNSSAATEIAMDLLDDGGNNNDKDCTLSGGCCNHNDDGCSEDEENRTFGDFIEAFVLNHPSKETRMLAASFVRVLLRSGGGCNGDQKKDVKERVAAVVWSFLEDVTNAPAQSGSEAFMSILPDACNSSSSSSSEGRELDLLTSLDTHTRRIASYPEASAVVFGWAKPKSCPVCLANSPSNAYYSVTGLCTRDMIQILPNGVSFMFSGRSDIAGRSSGGNSSSSGSGSGSGNVSGTSIMVKEIGVCLPLAREVTLSVAYRPPGGGGGEAKWVTVTKGRGLRRNFVGLGCGVHIAGIKVELAGINAGEEAKLVCPECGAALTSFVCKKCKLFAINMFVIIASECVIPVNSRITSDKDAESENEKLSTALSNVCIPPFSPK